MSDNNVIVPGDKPKFDPASVTPEQLNIAIREMRMAEEARARIRQLAIESLQEGGTTEWVH